jgi:hypothetical protein
MFVCDKCSLCDKNSWNYGHVVFKQYMGCNNGIRVQELNSTIDFAVLCVKGFMCIS